MIRAGRVAVNGTVVRELGVRADLARDRIEVDGERLTPPGERRTILLHKPRGVVSAMSDPEGRPTVAALVGAAGARLYPVGRLDVNTTGLLLLTNDGALAAALLDPRRALPRVYHAKVRGAPDEAAITRLRRGVHLPPPRARRTEPARVRVLERLPTKTWLEISVHEGHWRVVRRMCDAVGHPVEKLARVRFGPLALGELPWAHGAPSGRASWRGSGRPPASAAAEARDGDPERAGCAPEHDGRNRHRHQEAERVPCRRRAR
jgi:23S rRNA pseudouridine2605 synthase